MSQIYWNNMQLKGAKVIQLCVIVFFHGVLIMAISFCFIMSRHENKLIDTIIDRTVTQQMGDQQKVLALLNQTHTLLKPRAHFFSGQGRTSIRERFFTSSDVHLMDGKGACGSYAGVLTRILQRAGFESRLAQMKCEDEWGCHIVVETTIDGKLAVLDPMYNVAFKNKGGSLVSFSEVGERWSYFQQQIPNGYPAAYQYEDVRYTNWGKIPVLMPLIKTVLNVFMGSNADEVSVRSYVLNIYFVYLILLTFIYAILILVTFRFVRKL